MNSDRKEEIREHLDRLTKSGSIESVCVNCGACCHAGVNVIKGGNEFRVLVNDLHCKHMIWDGGESKCTVYKSRSTDAPWCADTQQMLEKGLVPKGCPYIDGLDNYKSTVVLDTDLYKSVTPILKEAISNGASEYGSAPFSDMDLRKFLDLG